MPDVDLCLIRIVHLIQNQLVFIKKLGPLGFVGFPKRGNRKKHGIRVECRLESYKIVRVFDCA